MTAQDITQAQTQATDTTLGPRFGWLLSSYDPKIKEDGNAPDTPETTAKVKAIHDGKVDVELKDGTLKTLSIPTVAHADEDAKGKPITIYQIDPKQTKGYVRTVTDKDGHNYQEVVTQAAQTGEPNTENASTIMQGYALKAQSSNAQDRQQFLDLQNKLESAGLLLKGKYIRGMPDDPTQQGLQSALVLADRTGQTLDEVLQQTAGSADANAAAAAKIKPSRLTNPADVAANAQKTAYGVIGKALDPGAVAQIQGNAEQMAQQQYTDSDGNSAYYSSSPSEAWLEQQIQQLMPQTTKAYSEFQGIGGVQTLLGNPTSPIGNLYHE